MQMEMKTCQEMIQGTAAPLVSTFRLSYYSLLNLMSRAEGQFNSEHVIRHSFHQFQHDKVIINFVSVVSVSAGIAAVSLCILTTIETLGSQRMGFLECDVLI